MEIKDISAKNRRVIKSYERLHYAVWDVHLARKPRWTKLTLAIFREETFWIRIIGKCPKESPTNVSSKYMNYYKRIWNRRDKHNPIGNFKWEPIVVDGQVIKVTVIEEHADSTWKKLYTLSARTFLQKYENELYLKDRMEFPT